MNWLNRLLLGWLAIALTSCAPVEKPWTLRAWQQPTMTVIISRDAPVCALWTTQQALEFLNVPVPTTVRIGDTDGEPRDGEVFVLWQKPNDAVGLTTLWLTDSQPKHAIIKFQQCEMRIMAHELGHVFGLLDTQEPNRLMTGSYPAGGWILTVDELRTLHQR